MSAPLLLSGEWTLALDEKPCRFDAPPADFPLTMTLPGTTAQQRIGVYNEKREDGFFTETYPFEGRIWLKRIIALTPEQLSAPHCFLHLERTRITRVWVNGAELGTENSLCTPHVYDLSGHLTAQTELVICVQNFDYPVPGGHMTSPDTQTNWIGITGSIRLEFHAETYISDLRAFPDAANRQVTVRGMLHGATQIGAKLSACNYPHCPNDKTKYHVPESVKLCADDAGAFSVTISLPENVPLWSEKSPAKIALYFILPNDEYGIVPFGLRDFIACGDHFALNGVPVMLRGKHDGMVFPHSGAAPTDLGAWLRYCNTLRAWGINHVRFHTCCPPEAAFAAADLCGILLEPELPFWGTLDDETGEKYNPDEQAYLIREGLRICKAFGNHPSFCMLSLGNELWGSPELLGQIIDTLRQADPRPLYTQGSNNFQHMPLQIPQEDFWTGVRTGRGRLIRGSYADCDAPLGMLQTHAPATDWDYEQFLVPQPEDTGSEGAAGVTEIDIQYGTGVKKVKAEKQTKTFYPTVPVVTHEIGQYNCYPDYREIEAYKGGVLEARSFEIFRERLEKAGMGAQAEEFFRSAGSFSRECYKQELEAAMRSPHIAGFQILDLQDFPGQGTALVGMLNSAMENKGFIQPEAWRGFCGDLVPLMRFDSFVRTAGETFSAAIALRVSRPAVKAQTAQITLTVGGKAVKTQTVEIPACTPGYHALGSFSAEIPADCIGRAELVFAIPDESVQNTWALTVLPPCTPVDESGVVIAHSFSEAEPHLQRGEAVLLLPEHISEKIPGFWCTDFWNYHMFKIISEKIGRTVPVGTMGLCIDTAHPVAQAMFSADFSEPQWYTAVVNADCAVLDAAPQGYRPAVQMIDNVERNHRLGLIFEGQVSGGRLLVCMVRFAGDDRDPGRNRLHHALCDYVQSPEFAPQAALDADMLRALFEEVPPADL